MDNPLRPLIETKIALVERYYPGLRFTDRWEWNHKVAYLSWLDTHRVGQKSTNPGTPISEDTIGIIDEALEHAAPGTSVYPANFEAVDLVQGSTGNLQWLSFGMVTQRFLVPSIADVSLIPSTPTPPTPTPDPDTVPWQPYWGDAASTEISRTLFFDYSRRPEAPNSGMGTWLNRCLHSAFLGPVPPSQGGSPLGTQGALDRHRPEWCAALGVDPNVPVPPGYQG